MAYIGVQPAAGQYRKLDDVSAGFNGTSTTFTTSVSGENVTAGTAQQLLVSVGGVIQEPKTDYDVSTNSIVFTTAPAAGLDFFAVLMGDAVNTITVPDGSVTTAKLAGSLSVGLAGGTNSAPTLFFTGDTNTGVYSPGADQVAVTTGGTQRLLIDASGNVNVDSNTLYVDAANNRVGVGTSSPSDVLHVEGVIRTSSGGSNAQFANNYLRSNQAGTFYFDQNSGSQDFAFRVSNVTNLDTTAMTIKSSGRVGIGTSSPAFPLHVVATTDGPQTLATLTNLSTGGTNETAALGFVLNGAAGSGACRISAGKDSDFSTNANIDSYLAFSTTLNDTESERLRITSAGNVGIGTTSPSVKLDVNGDIFASGGDIYTGANRMLSSDSTIRPLIFGIGAGEKARIDSSGRLLVGTSSSYGVGSSAQAKFQASDTTSNIHASFTDWSTANSGGIIVLGKAKGGSAGNYTIVANNDILGEIRFAGADGTDLETNGALIRAEVDGTPGANDMPGRLVFSTTADGASSPTERMRLDNKGSLSLWTPGNTTAAPQDVDARIFAFSDTSNSVLYIDSRRAGEFIHINQSYADSVNRGAVAFYRNESQIGSISISSAQVFYNTTSDYRLKENVVDLENATALVKQLKPRSFNFISEPDTAINGFIAHEVQAVAPEAVTGEKDAIDDEGNPKYQGIDQSKLVPLLTAALQEALTRIEQLEAAVTALQQS